jgi:vancomycin resistance protein YoaR
LSTEYRLSWESPSPHECAVIEAQYGHDVWPTYNWESIFSWHRTEKITDDASAQYNTLKAWAKTREQPIRNVRLEQRERPTPDEGWLRVKEEQP